MPRINIRSRDMPIPRRGLTGSETSGVSYKGEYFARIQSVSILAPGRLQVKTARGTYKLEGGKKLGGRASDWFLEGPSISGYMVVRGILDGLRMINNI